MRVLFIGKIGRGQTSGMRCGALARLGHQVKAMDSGLWPNSSWVRRQVEQRLERGTDIARLNRDILALARKHSASLVWAEKQNYIKPETIVTLQREGRRVVHYNPDPYFSVPWKRTRLADACLSLYDLAIVTKKYELPAYRDHCNGEVTYSPLGYDARTHRPPSRSCDGRFRSEVAFVGGWEPRREQVLLRLLPETTDLRIWGYGWQLAQSARGNPLRALRLGRLDPRQRPYLGRPRRKLGGCIREGEGPHGEIYEENYSLVTKQAGINIGFLRSAWPDQHTTRTFEIPAMQGFMLADRSDEHEEFYREGVEAEFFEGAEECLDKVRFYLKHPAVGRRIAAAGRARSERSGYSYDARLATVFGSAEVLAT